MPMSPGGFIEHCSTNDIRPRPAMTLPNRGPFDFPAPWGTRGIRLTNSTDTAGVDALWPCGYSYWSNINAHKGQPRLRVFLGVDRNRGGAGPCLWEVDKATDAVDWLGPLFPPDSPLSWSTAEGWYWSKTDPDILYCSDLERLYRYNVVTRELRAVVDIAIPPYAGSGKVLWQWHSSNDGLVHSATLKDGLTYQAEGAIVYREGQGPDVNPWLYFAKLGADYDECQIDAAGRYLLIKENFDQTHGEDNRILDLYPPGGEWPLLDEHGAAGHSDNGYGYMVAADNWNDLPGALRLWTFDRSIPGRLVYHTPVWGSELAHVSHGNAQATAGPSGQYVVGSNASRQLLARNNEICGLRLDGSLEVLVIAPVLTDLDAPGTAARAAAARPSPPIEELHQAWIRAQVRRQARQRGPTAFAASDYDNLPKGNLDATGEYFLWTSNHGSNRLDAFLVKVPGHLLTPTPPVPECIHCPVHCP